MTYDTGRVRGPLPAGKPAQPGSVVLALRVPAEPEDTDYDYQACEYRRRDKCQQHPLPQWFLLLPECVWGSG